MTNIFIKIDFVYKEIECSRLLKSVDKKYFYSGVPTQVATDAEHA